MVKSKGKLTGNKTKKCDSDNNTSMTEVDMMLAQAKLAEQSVDGSTKCLTCLRSIDQKYCYDSETGAGKCCLIEDIDSDGCNQKANSDLVCSTDKIISKSSICEVCPHNPDQCDTKLLYLNNQQWGSKTPQNNSATYESTSELILEEDTTDQYMSQGFFEGLTIPKT